jgi:hypothetical protein
VKLLALAAAALCLARAEMPPGVPRQLVETAEQEFHTSLLNADPVDRIEVLAFPQGVYLPRYGLVFTAKVNLIAAPAITPFRQTISPQDIARIRDRKMKKLPLLKSTIKQFLLRTAKSLDQLPGGEQIVVAVALYRSSWENSEGLPQQIVLHAERRALLSRLAAADAAIKMEEY